MNVTIENPLILILGAIFAIWPTKNRHQLVTIQKLVLFYLACVFINLASDEYFTISVWRWSINVSYGALGVVFLSGMFFLKGKSITEDEVKPYRSILGGWWVAMGIIVVHMVVLFIILKWFYGYGYEHDLKSLGAVCGCLILFVCMWRGLGFWWIRCILGVGFIAGGSLL